MGDAQQVDAARMGEGEAQPLSRSWRVRLLPASPLRLADGGGLVQYRGRELQDSSEMGAPVGGGNAPPGLPAGDHGPVGNAVATTARLAQRLGQGVLGLAQPL